jgi:CRP/FNR family transcriptional regulator
MEDAPAGRARSDPLSGERGAAAGGAALDGRAVFELLGVPLTDSDAVLLARHRFPLLRLRAGQCLYRQGARCDALYAARTGALRSAAVDDCGAEQVLAFPLPGDLLGGDGLADGHYRSSACALEASEVAVLGLTQLCAAMHESPALELAVLGATARPSAGQIDLLFLLGTLGAEARVAAFLLDLGERYEARGGRRDSISLPMTRRDIGLLLGLQIETISRALSSLIEAGLIAVAGRQVEIVDRARLQQMLDSARQSGSGSIRPLLSRARAVRAPPRPFCELMPHPAPPPPGAAQG